MGEGTVIDSVPCKTIMLFEEREERGGFKTGDFAGVVPFYAACMRQLQLNMEREWSGS
jgi:hypothetical protein